MIWVSHEIITPNHEIAAVAIFRLAGDGLANNEDPGTAAQDNSLAMTLWV